MSNNSGNPPAQEADDDDFDFDLDLDLPEDGSESESESETGPGEDVETDSETVVFSKGKSVPRSAPAEEEKEPFSIDLDDDPEDTTAGDAKTVSLDEKDREETGVRPSAKGDEKEGNQNSVSVESLAPVSQLPLKKDVRKEVEPETDRPSKGSFEIDFEEEDDELPPGAILGPSLRETKGDTKATGETEDSEKSKSFQGKTKSSGRTASPAKEPPLVPHEGKLPSKVARLRFQDPRIYLFVGLGVIFAIGLAVMAWSWISGNGNGGQPEMIGGAKVAASGGEKKETPSQPKAYGTAFENGPGKADEIKSVAIKETVPKEIELEARKAVEQFFSATNVDELLKVSRDAERVEPLMRAYYETHALLPREVKSVQLEDENLIGDRVFWLLEVQLDRFEDVLVAAEKAKDGFFIDWETRVYYNPVDWEVFVQDRPKGRYAMRVLATLNSEYRYPFNDDQRYLCVQLGAFGSDAEVFGYAERESETARRISGILTGDFSNQSEYPLILELEFPADSDEGGNLVHIRDFVAENWIIIEQE